jgi:nucleoside-diphosphate-sugar epimerase
MMGNSFELVVDKARLRPVKSEVDRLLADNSKAKEIIKWEPTVSLDEGLKLTIEWFRLNSKLYKENLYNI